MVGLWNKFIAAWANETLPRPKDASLHPWQTSRPAIKTMLLETAWGANRALGAFLDNTSTQQGKGRPKLLQL